MQAVLGEERQQEQEVVQEARYLTQEPMDQTHHLQVHDEQVGLEERDRS